MIVDKNYCMSSYLMFRTIADENRTFSDGVKPELFKVNFEREAIHNSMELATSLCRQVTEATKDGKAALMLSGGIDSAILAKYMPKGSTIYTLKCVVPNVQVTDETPRAAQYAKECGLHQKVIEIYWEDFEKYAPILMKHKGAPIHSIEVQIYKATLQARKDGYTSLIFGESADLNYGGLSGLLSRDWTFGEFVDRYSYVLPYKVLKNPVMVLEPYRRYEKNGYIDVNDFCRDFFLEEALGSYTNACEVGAINFCAPYAETRMAVPLDLQRIRSGENKYLIREVFKKLYRNFNIPQKTPMPRPTAEWLKKWKGPVRAEFWPNCINGMSGDQKWLVYALELYLNHLNQ